jgi:hypothetical protein
LVAQKRDAVCSRICQLDVIYTPPCGFDTQKVEDLVASHRAFNPEDSDHRKSTAFKIVAGSKLYNVATEDGRVGKGLLK